MMQGSQKAEIKIISPQIFLIFFSRVFSDSALLMPKTPAQSNR